jgi:ethanolamine phosphate phosphodiesterase
MRVGVPRSLKAIKFAWVAVVLLFEVVIFIDASARCQWPDPAVRICFPLLFILLHSPLLCAYTGLITSTNCRQGKGKEATHVLIVADPQILDERSYPGRSSLLRAISQIFVDMNLRKAWRVAKSTRPHAVIFLGDMMDNGFADTHITRCVGCGHPLRFPSSTSPSVVTGSMSRASIRSSPLLHRSRCTMYRETTM